MSDKERLFGEGADLFGLTIVKTALPDPEYWSRVEDCLITSTKVLYEMVSANPVFKVMDDLTEEQFDAIAEELGASAQAMNFAENIRGIVGELVSATYVARALQKQLEEIKQFEETADTTHEVH